MNESGRPIVGGKKSHRVVVLLPNALFDALRTRVGSTSTVSAIVRDILDKALAADAKDDSQG